MKKIIIYLSIILISNIYAQCDDYSLNQCNNDTSCEWVEDIEIGNCGNLWGDDCELNPECNWNCDFVDDYMGWCNYSCDGGPYEIDNSYCQQMEILECSGLLTESNCNHIDECEWVENLEIENCYDILDCTGGCTWQDCEAIEGCNWHFGTAYYDPSYCYGEHEVDNSYCEEIVMPECSEMNESQCSNDDECDWTENIEWGSCEDLTPIWNVIYYCDDLSTNLDNCYTYNCYGGGYGQWGTCCAGDPYIIADNSYCEEIPYELGDVNQDSIINIQDVILAINLILNGEFDLSADINLDSIVNVLDVIQIVNIILSN